MRPTYETHSHWQNQEAVRRRISEKFGGIDAFMTPKYYPWDYLFFDERGHAVACGEYKRRHVSYSQLEEWGGFRLSYHKYESGIRFCDHTGLSFWLYIELNSDIEDSTELYRCVFSNRNENVRIGIIGRFDRNDPQDKEPCVIIPMNKFTRIE
tara:strand:- start:193 stop:651 length:459 start_codon:yes stop_codon:yes gene_type:complete